MLLNPRLAPFDRIAARQALDLAVDRSRIARLAGGLELARPTCQVLPPEFPGYYPYCTSTIDPGPAGLWRGAQPSLARALVAASGTSGEPDTETTAATHPCQLATLRPIPQLPHLTRYRTTPPPIS